MDRWIDGGLEEVECCYVIEALERLEGLGCMSRWPILEDGYVGSTAQIVARPGRQIVCPC